MTACTLLSTRRWLAAGPILFLAAGCRNDVESPVEPSFDRVKPGASFEWSMPDRFGLDQDGDGLVDYPRAAEQIHPASWTVNFDACAMEPGKRYDWQVGKGRVASVTDCRWSYAFPAEGRYDVTLHVIRNGGPGSFAEQVVTVQDWLIVSFGDSYASGEGVPEIPAANDQLLASIAATLASLEDARRNVDAAKASLDEAVAKVTEAFENKGLAESILATQQQRFNDFLTACKIETFKDIVDCANFLAGLPFDTYQTASAHFQQLVSDAQERLDDLNAAYLAAQSAWNSALNAFNAAQGAVTNLLAVIAQLQAGLGQAKWQAQFANEDWADDDCHRSAFAAPARAALALERSDPHTSVTFVHLACTGAQVDKFRARLEQQIPWAEALIGGREIDAVLLSIGGNDAGFASIATACVVQQACYDDEPVFDPTNASGVCTLLGFFGLGTQCTDFFGNFPAQSAKLLVEAGVADLPAKYQEVGGVLLPGLTGLLAPGVGDPVDRVRSNRVFITPYIDMTKGDAGAYCTQDPNNLLGMIPAITPDELQWLDLSAAGSINQAIANAAATHGWNAVTGIYNAYATHGYCADNHWVTRIYESLIRQGDVKGMAHPNYAGHAHNGERIFTALLGSLYPQGLAGGARAPD